MRPRRAPAALLAGLGVLLAASLVVGLVLLVTDDDPSGPPCNGHAELCSRSYDEVAFAATHNSMSAAAERGWFFPDQPDGIVAQLDHGIRVLLVDSWYGQRTDRPGVVATAGSRRSDGIAEANGEFGEIAVRAALRARGASRLAPRGPITPYLCHAMCELGSTPWLQSLEDTRAWLDEHPREVVTMFVQDIVTPEDTAEVFTEAGLLPYVYTPTSRSPDRWPTLGEMIDSGHRLVVLMEEHGGGSAYPWLLQGFDRVQDTPYLFASAADFTCTANRGPADASIFLVNHWIDAKTRPAAHALEVNARDVLLPRLQECEAERGRLPNYVAVDYYNRGDLLDVVDELNGF